MVIGKVTRGNGYEHLKKEQLSAIEKLVSGQDVFVMLTGFGKKLMYELLPTVFDRLKGHTAPTSIALIVSPMVSQQTQRCTYVLLDQQTRCFRSLMMCYNINSSHLTMKTCVCETIT